MTNDKREVDVFGFTHAKTSDGWTGIQSLTEIGAKEWLGSVLDALLAATDRADQAESDWESKQKDAEYWAGRFDEVANRLHAMTERAEKAEVDAPKLKECLRFYADGWFDDGYRARTALRKGR